ncbi:hypothetical protein C8R45DRAFT_1104543 [Mycena sanguinolenta]|nr:hypothetical protein C8R45DRAFT_1104543 [Mycena sanguinolenta]
MRCVFGKSQRPSAQPHPRLAILILVHAVRVANISLLSSNSSYIIARPRVRALTSACRRFGQRTPILAFGLLRGRLFILKTQVYRDIIYKSFACGFGQGSRPCEHSIQNSPITDAA